MIEIFSERFPGVPLDDYLYGALIARPDAKRQYEQIMEFPPFIEDIERGRQIWETPFRNGKTFAGCFPDGAHNVAGNYPYFDPALRKIVTFEMAINRCLRENGETEFAYGEAQSMGQLTAYARSLSDGMRLNIQVPSPAALEKYLDGRDTFFRRRGQMNVACASCHLNNAGRIMRDEVISPALGQATHWPVFKAGERLYTFQSYLRRCMTQMRAVAFPLGGEEMNNLEYFLSYLSTGLPMKAAVYRK